MLIRRAVELDNSGRYADALVCYREGVEVLMDTLKTITDDKKRIAYREKIFTYIERAEKLKKLVDEIKESGKYHEQINIEDNAVGYSYEKVFSRFLKNEFIEAIEVDDAYIKTRHQTHNFLRFCETVVKLVKSIKKIILLTTKDEDPNSYHQQDDRLNEIKESLAKRKIELQVKYSQNLHDREIRLSSGWIIKIGRGLDYFKPPESKDKLCLGFHDYDLRPCHATTIDIFHKSSTKIR